MLVFVRAEPCRFCHTMDLSWLEKQFGMNLELDLQFGFDVEPVNRLKTFCAFGKSVSPWLCDVDTVMDNSFDYLMPTSMSRARMSRSLPPFTLGGIFDQSLKALESDTCSDISEQSFAQFDSYDRLHQFRKADFGRSRSDTDLEEYVLPWEHSFKIGESFDKSLQNFLQWPNADSCNNVAADIDDFPSRRKGYEKKRHKSVKPRNMKSIPKIKIQSENDSFQDIESTDDDDSSVFSPGFRGSGDFDSSNFAPIDTSEKFEKGLKAGKPKWRHDRESDSDYRTYSDASSDRIICSENCNEADVDNLKFLMSSVFEKAEKITQKLKEIDVTDAASVSNSRANNTTNTRRTYELMRDVKENKNYSSSRAISLGLQKIEISENSKTSEKRDSSSHIMRQKGVIRSSEKTNYNNFISSDSQLEIHTSDTKAGIDSKTGISKSEYKFQNFRTNNVGRNSNFRSYSDGADTNGKATVMANDNESDSESFVSFIQRLVRSLGKKEGELEGFKDLLKRAEESLTQSETAVEVMIVYGCVHLFHVLSVIYPQPSLQ